MRRLAGFYPEDEGSIPSGPKTPPRPLRLEAFSSHMPREAIAKIQPRAAARNPGVWSNGKDDGL